MVDKTTGEAIQKRENTLWKEHKYPSKEEYERFWGSVNRVPSADRPTDEEDQLKFYYVESIDDYWIGMRIDNFYYADWHEGLGFVWSKSRHLPWGEQVVDENTLWKVHTYPSKPVEIPFTDWIVGFVKKYFADRPTGEWIPCSEKLPFAEYGESDVVLVTCESALIKLLYFNGGNWCYPTGECYEHSIDKVIAWMPLPEPWKGADDETNRR